MHIIITYLGLLKSHKIFTQAQTRVDYGVDLFISCHNTHNGT